MIPYELFAFLVDSNHLVTVYDDHYLIQHIYDHNVNNYKGRKVPIIKEPASFMYTKQHLLHQKWLNQLVLP